MLCTTPCMAITQSQANAYYKGIKDLGNIQKVCDANGYKSMLTDTYINYLYPQLYTAPMSYGLTDFTHKLIFVSTWQSDEYIEYTTIHEYAHALSRIGNLHINGVEDILYTEMPNLAWYQMTFNPYNPRSTYCSTSKDEYFAEAFAMYYFHPDALQTYCPITYNYIKNVNKLFNGK